jgi:hypothetical protein
MTRTIAALLTATTIAGVCAPAAAQTRYYARERLATLTASTPSTPPAPVCETLVGQSGRNGGTLADSADGVTTIAAAQSFCTTAAAKFGVGVCRWNSPAGASNTSRSFYYKGSTIVDAGQGSAASYAAWCR